MGPTPGTTLKLHTAAATVTAGGGGPVAALVRASADGDELAWQRLVDRFSGLVWSIARSHRLSAADAADVSQVVWLRLVEHLDQIRQPERLSAWLASVTRHECLRTLRRSEREVTTGDDLEITETPLAGRDSVLEQVDDRLLDEARQAALRRAFETLPVRWQAMLRILMSSPSAGYEDVAVALGMPIGSIGPTRLRCIERLRRHPELRGVALDW